MAAIAEQTAEGVLPRPFVAVLEQRQSGMATGQFHLALLEADAAADEIEKLGAAHVAIARMIRTGAPTGSFLCVVRAMRETTLHTLAAIQRGLGGSA